MHYNEKRFEYNINPQIQEDFDLYTNKYTPVSRNNRDYSVLAASPISRRPQVNNTFIEERTRYSNPNINQPDNTFYAPSHQQEPLQYRGRANSTGFKRTQDRVSVHGKTVKTPVPEDFNRFAKKNYMGKDQSFEREYQTSNVPKERNPKINKNEQTKKHIIEEAMKAEENQAARLQQNINISNLRGQHRQKARRSEAPEQAGKQTINQKEIMDKINRINRLNEQINSRLQRMLTKMDACQ